MQAYYTLRRVYAGRKRLIGQVPIHTHNRQRFGYQYGALCSKRPIGAVGVTISQLRRSVHVGRLLSGQVFIHA